MAIASQPPPPPTLKPDDADRGFSLQGLLDQLRETPVQSLLERVDELRGRLVRFVIVLCLFFMGCYALSQPVFNMLKAPLLEALPKGSQGLNFTGPMDVFVSYLHVAFMLAAMIVTPYGIWQAYKFLSPALPPRSRGKAVPYLIWSVVLFYAGVTFCHLVMMPTTLHFLIELGSEVAMPIINVTDYVSLVVFMMLGFGVVFQLPVALLVAEALGVIRLEQLTSSRNVVIVVILVVAAVVTPTPDPFSQLAMAIPMYLMYEIAIVLIRIKRRKDPRP